MASRKAERKSKKARALAQRALRNVKEGGAERQARLERQRRDRERMEAFKAEEARNLERARAETAAARGALAAEEAALRDRSPALGKDLPDPNEVPSSGVLGGIRRGIRKTRESLSAGLGRVMLGKKEWDGETRERLEELLITADLGMDTTRRLLDAVQARAKRADGADTERIKTALRDEIRLILERKHTPAGEGGAESGSPRVLLFLGVNGTGKTTTIGKIATAAVRDGRRVLLAAGDTFRAAAAEQLGMWAERAGCDLVRRAAGSDPGAVIHQAVARGAAEGYDLVLCDTAGRLHTKHNLMEELKKIKRVIGKALPGAPHESWLVLDANTGQNAVLQTRDFHAAIGLSGLIVTKLDGTARGGVVVGIVNEFDIPIRYIGVGEGVDDLQLFDPAAFADNMIE